MKCLRRRVVLKRNFHLKGSECIRAEFAVGGENKREQNFPKCSKVFV